MIMEQSNSTASLVGAQQKSLLASLYRDIDVSSRFPSQVFIGAWADFLFFDPDWVIDSSFISTVKAMMEIEGANSACITHLDTQSISSSASFFVRKETSDSEYQSFLNSGMWVANMGRWGCVSETNNWCIYCERENEIGVIGFEQGGMTGLRSVTARMLKAFPIDKAISGKITYAFKRMRNDWCIELVRHYKAGGPHLPAVG
jgi:hypothetical protein